MMDMGNGLRRRSPHLQTTERAWRGVAGRGVAGRGMRRGCRGRNSVLSHVSVGPFQNAPVNQRSCTSSRSRFDIFQIL